MHLPLGILKLSQQPPEITVISLLCLNALWENKLTEKPSKPALIIYGIAVWIILNILLMASILLSGDWADLNNYIEIALWALSIPALLTLRKWGAAFTLFTFSYTLSTSVGILIYYLATDPAVWPNIIRVIINAAVIIYLFRALFKGKFK
jgi:hypothetical protein